MRGVLSESKLKLMEKHLKYTWWLLISVSTILSIWLTYMAHHSVSPEWNYWVGCLILLGFISAISGPGMIISFLIGIIIGLLI